MTEIDSGSDAPRTYYLETLGCPKNQVDSDKLEGTMVADGMVAAATANDADLIVVNTCAFIEEARQESIHTILSLHHNRADGAKLVVTGCMAERYGDELAEALPEADSVAGFGVPVSIGTKPGTNQSAGQAGETAELAASSFDLLHLPRPRAEQPWAYVKIAEGCDRACGFCAIPTFRGPQRSRTVADICSEVDQLGVREVVLVAQDLAAFGRDQGKGERRIVELVQAVSDRVDWVRLLYLYPSDLTDALIRAICATGVPYFDLSLQHVSRPLLRRMRRWGDGAVFAERIEAIRAHTPHSTFRSNFIVGYPGETEDDHDQLIEFIEAARLDWCGFFAYSPEPGTYAVDLDSQISPELVADRLAELREIQDQITEEKRDQMVGSRVQVLVETAGIARSHREAPEIDGIIEVPETLPVGEFTTVQIVSAAGPDLVAVAPDSGSAE